jgi:hypothetical protein
MRSQATLVLALIVSAGLSVQVMARKPGSATRVTSTIVDSSTYQIGSDGLGPYTDSSTFTSLILGTDGNYQLGGFYDDGSTRTVALDLGAGISGTGPNGGAPVTVPNGLYNVNIASDTSAVNPQGFFCNYLNVAPGSTIQCSMNVHFVSGGNTYDLTQNAAAYSETNFVSITCTSAVGSPCSAWTVQPSAASGSDVANLSIEKTAKGKLTHVNQGDFLVSFLIHLTHP